jgi:hypothetical protein
VNDDEKQRASFPLRLATSLKQRAKLLATQDGISLNHFISMAVAEKISRLHPKSSTSETGPHQKTANGLDLYRNAPKSGENEGGMLTTDPHAHGTRVRCEVVGEFTAYSMEDLLPRTIPAGHAVFAILTPGETDEIDFAWGSLGDIWYRAPRDLFLKSTRH